MRWGVHNRQVAFEQRPLLTIVFLILVIFLTIILPNRLYTFVKQSVIHGWDFFYYVGIDNVRLPINASNQFAHFKSINYGMTGFRLNQHTFVKLVYYKFIHLVQENIPTEQWSFLLLFLLASLTFQTNVKILDLHYDIFFNFWQINKFLCALLRRYSPHITQQPYRIKNFLISRVCEVTMTRLLFFNFLSFKFHKVLLILRQLVDYVRESNAFALSTAVIL